MRRRKCLIAIVLILLLLLQSVGPLCRGVNATSSVTITLNSELYAAVKASLVAQNIAFSYSDANKTITISETNLASVTYLDLSNGSIDDLTGLSSFQYVTDLNLTANELTIDSNLTELDSLPLTKLNLSSNKIESVSSISTFDSIAETDITNQEVTKKEIITVDISEESDHSKTYTISLPDILLKDTGSLDADWFDAEVDGSCSVDWATVSGTILKLNVGSGYGDNYTALTGLITIKVDVKDSTSKLANTKMTLYYVVVNSDETGIIFNDSNFYNAVKSQLTAKQTENEELASYGENGETLYLRAYDDALILVIDNDTLINKITSFILNDKKIKDLTGLEAFVGLDTEINLSYNYIDSIDKILELDENKDLKESELQTKYSKYLSNLSSYRSSLKSALEEYKTLQETYEKLENSDNSSDTEKSTAEQNLASKATTIATYRNLISATLEKLYSVYQNEYLLTTILTTDTVTLTYSDIYNADLSTIKSYAESIMSKVSSLEESESLSDWETELIIETFGISQTTTINGEETEIENPITAYFNTQKEGADLLTISNYEDFVYKMKIIDAIIVAGNYCLNECLYGEATSCSLSEGLEKLISDLDTFGYNTTFAEIAKSAYEENGLDCMCSMLEDLEECEIEEIISGKYASASDLVSTFVKLPRLKNLNMTDNSVESIDGIETLAELETLNMYKNLLDDVTTVDWSELTNLTNLNLGYNQLSDINCLEVLTNLQYLDLTKNLLSGSFSFSLVGLEDLVFADFSYNQISDIAYFINQFKFRAKAAGMNVEDYVLSDYCPTVKFQKQTLSLSVTVTLDNSFITIDLPSIYEQAESIDNTRTSFGIDSLLGTVEANGTTVKLYTPSTGERTAVVKIEGYNGNAYTTDGIAYGTICTITYTVVESIDNEEKDVEDPADDTEDGDADDNGDDDENTGATTKDITYGYTVDDGYVYVNTPEISLSTFANNVVTSSGYTVTVVNSNDALNSYIATGAVVTVETSDGETVAALEVVVLGDVNGDGEVDALDSGIVRKVINDTTSLVGVYAEAADVNMDEDIDSLDALLILYYRADKISSFE